jgi:starch phosphorylase
MKGNDYERARRLASWKADLRRHWADIHIEEVEADQRLEVQVGSMVTVRARIVLGNLRPEDVSVQIYNGRVDSSGSLADAQVVPMNRRDGTSNGQHVYQGSVPCQASGLHGFSIRVVPYSEIPSEIHDLGLIIWQ